MLRGVENILDRAGFDHLAQVHDADPVGDFCDHAHVMGDEHHRHAELVLQLADQVQDFRLGGDVEGGRRFVGDQHDGVAGQRHGDHRPLTHAAGILKRIAVDGVFRIGDLDALQQIDDALAPRPFVQVGMDAQRLVDLAADRVHGRQRTHRLLKNHRDFAPADRPDLPAARVQGGQIDDPVGIAADAVQQYLAAHDLAGGGDDLQDRPGGHTLARTGLADDAQRIAAPQGEADIVDGLEHAGAQREMGLQMPHLQRHVTPRQPDGPDRIAA